MWPRTITLSSCGKTFSVTGWQVGWMVGPAAYIAPVQEMLPCVQFCTATPVQQALTLAIKQADYPYLGYNRYGTLCTYCTLCYLDTNSLTILGIVFPTIFNYCSYYEWLRSQFAAKRAALSHSLQAVGIEPLPSQGGFFLMAKLPEWTLSKHISALSEPYDWKLCRQMCENFGVVAIPASAFYAPNKNTRDTNVNSSHMARFAFCKLDETLAEAARRFGSNTNC